MKMLVEEFIDYLQLENYVESIMIDTLNDSYERDLK